MIMMPMRNKNMRQINIFILHKHPQVVHILRHITIPSINQNAPAKNLNSSPRRPKKKTTTNFVIYYSVKVDFDGH